MLIIYPVSTITAILFVHRPLGGCYMYMYSTVHLDVIKYYICLTQIGTWITSAASGLIMVTFEIQCNGYGCMATFGLWFLIFINQLPEMGKSLENVLFKL